MAYNVHKEHRQKTLNEIPTIWSYQITAYIYWWSSAGKDKAPESRVDETGSTTKALGKNVSFLCFLGSPSAV